MSLELDKSAWKRVKLGEVASASKEKVDPYDGTVDRFVAGEHMNTDDLKIHRCGDPGEVDLGPAFQRRFRPGQVLYGSRRTYLRKVAVADFDGVCANTTFVVGTNDPRVLLQEFLPFVMTSEPFHAFASAESKGSVNPYVNWSDIARYEFELPPLEEQKHIADLLWAIESHIRATSATTAALSRAADESFSTGLRAIRKLAVPLPTMVDEMTVGVVVRPTQYYTDAADGVPALRGLNIRPGGFELDDLVRFKPESAAELAKSTLRLGDVVIVRTGRPGDAAVVTAETAGFNCIDLIIARPVASLVPKFLELFLNSSYGRDQVTRLSAGTAQQHFNVGALKKLQIPKLDRGAQIDLIEAVENIREAELASRTEQRGLSTLRASLLAKIFGGN